jgi:hypothetical protein
LTVLRSGRLGEVGRRTTVMPRARPPGIVPSEHVTAKRSVQLLEPRA